MDEWVMSSMTILEEPDLFVQGLLLAFALPHALLACTAPQEDLCHRTCH